MKTLFTIIVPVFNTAPYLEKCIQSLLLQTMREIEVILVDDGSTDESGRICDGFKHDPRIKVIHKKNEGQGIALSLIHISAGMMWLTERSNCIRGHKKESDAGTDK